MAAWQVVDRSRPDLAHQMQEDVGGTATRDLASLTSAAWLLRVKVFMDASTCLFRYGVSLMAESEIAKGEMAVIMQNASHIRRLWRMSVLN